MQLAITTRRQWIVPVVFTATIFTSASLLFFVQPMFARMVLPLLGGSSAVWTTAMLFFQSVLIIGYLYAHLSVKWLPRRMQVMVHMAVWALALVFLPITVPSGWTYDPARPAAIQTLWLFAVGVGLPFAALSATAPLLQAWYSRSDGPSSNDPYFLYGASNLGSLLSLLAFPFVAEPLFGVRAIGDGWAAIYVALGAGLFASGMMMRPAIAAVRPAAEKLAAPRLAFRQIATWAFLAFLPSSLMLSTTATIATDVGSFPLVWVIPLSLYLLSFVVAFSRSAWPGGATLGKLFLVFFLYALFIYAGGLTGKLGWLPFGVLICFFLLAAILSHRKLYELRPDERSLTAYYVTMSVGGALGGLFNSILAPSLFNDVYEGPLTLLACALLLPGVVRVRSDLGAGLRAAFIAALPVGGGLLFGAENLRPYAMASAALFFIAFWPLRERRIAFLTGAALLLLAGQIFLAPPALLKERSFFGTYAVRDKGDTRVLAHGTTFHGAEMLADIGRHPHPATYYFRTAPLARVVNASALPADGRVGIVGLGVGGLACYRKPGQEWHYYEIDQVVDDIARTSGLFDFMPMCGADVPTHIGDARLALAGQDLAFDLLMIDAYSSDAIPVHLMTTEAVSLYLNRLSQDGILVFHISNRFFDLQPVLARIAREVGLEARFAHYVPSADLIAQGAAASDVVVMARRAQVLDRYLEDSYWVPMRADDRPAWTDDHANLLSALR